MSVLGIALQLMQELYWESAVKFLLDQVQYWRVCEKNTTL